MSSDASLSTSYLSDYDYFLPPELIAQSPVTPRDESRLFVLHRRSQTWEHRRFRDIAEYLDSNDLLIANNTRVIRARLVGRRILIQKGVESYGGQVEFFMLERVGPKTWEGLFHASAKKYVAGIQFEIPTQDSVIRGKLIRGSADSPTGTVVAEFDRDPVESGAGQIPLPPYVERAPALPDEETYQTVYSKELGSAAAPTAGLHFTPSLIEKLLQQGVGWDEITLHVGLGTFRPVKSEEISKHQMHEERYSVSSAVAKRVTDWKHSGKRVLAVGTTSVRTLESAWKEQELIAGPNRTSIFIWPGSGHRFQVVDRLLTNFHLPKSTLIMLVSAFAGKDFVMAAYEEAVRQRYRFFSYGDAMLIL